MTTAAATGATVWATGADDAGGGVDAVDAGGAAGATGTSDLAVLDTTGVTWLAGAVTAGALATVEAAGPPAGVPVEDGWAGAGVAGAGALTWAAGSGAGLTDAGAAVAAVEVAAVEVAAVEVALIEVAPVGPVVELGAEVGVSGVADEVVESADDPAELADDVADEVAEPTAEVTGDAAEPTVEVTEDVAEVTVDEGPESVDARVALRGDRAAVAAWAGRRTAAGSRRCRPPPAQPAPLQERCDALLAA